MHILSSPIADSRSSFERRGSPNALALDERMPKAQAGPRFSLAPMIFDERVRKILRMVERGTTFTIRELANEFHLTPSYLQRLFKQQTGVSMGVWLNEQRLQKAASLLSNSYMSVKEVAYTIGYEHASSFIRAFERRFTQAPARYRKQRDHAKC